MLERQLLYVMADDCYKSVRVGRNKKVYRIRVITFNTDRIICPIKKRPILTGKRFTYIISATGIIIYKKQVIQLIKNKVNEFYDYKEFPTLIFFGDGAQWIKSVAKDFNGIYVNDKFHSYRILTNAILANHRRSSERWKLYQQLIRLYEIGEFDNFFKILKENNVKKSVIQYFKKIKNGIENQNLEYNIGCSAESNIHHLVKSLCAGSRIFSYRHFANLLFEKSKKFNN